MNLLLRTVPFAALALLAACETVQTDRCWRSWSDAQAAGQFGRQLERGRSGC